MKIVHDRVNGPRVYSYHQSFITKAKARERMEDIARNKGRNFTKVVECSWQYNLEVDPNLKSNYTSSPKV